MKFLLLLLLATAFLLGQLVTARPQRPNGGVGDPCRSKDDCRRRYVCTSSTCARKLTKTRKPKYPTTTTNYCPTTPPTYTPPPGVGERCYSHNDCPDKLACIYNKCAVTETPEPSIGINLHDCVPYGTTSTVMETTTSPGYQTSTTTSPGYETGTTATTSPGYPTDTTTSPSYTSPTTSPYTSPTTSPYTSPTTTSPATSPTASPSGGGTCSWPGHCEGDSCRYDDECEQQLSCQDGTCTAA